jgi:hypothetical protein
MDIINDNKPTPRSRHIDIQHFAIQEWRDEGILKAVHIPGVINPSDAVTKALASQLHQRRVRQLMGHHGRPDFKSEFNTELYRNLIATYTLHGIIFGRPAPFPDTMGFT